MLCLRDGGAVILGDSAKLVLGLSDPILDR